MKKINIAYWIVTGLFAAFMVSTSIPNITSNEDSIKFIADGLGYPAYLIPFLGWAKILGVIVILIPKLDRIKEWAYAGLCFDLAGATFSVIASYGLDISILGMAPPIIFLFTSYFLNRKKMSLEVTQ